MLHKHSRRPLTRWLKNNSWAFLLCRLTEFSRLWYFLRATCLPHKGLTIFSPAYSPYPPASTVRTIFFLLLFSPPRYTCNRLDSWHLKTTVRTVFCNVDLFVTLHLFLSFSVLKFSLSVPPGLGCQCKVTCFVHFLVSSLVLTWLSLFQINLYVFATKPGLLHIGSNTTTSCLLQLKMSLFIIWKNWHFY